MKLEQVFSITFMVFVLMNAGCAGLDGRMPALTALSGQESSLREALEKLRAGNEPQARELLEKVAAGVPTAGISDEALFRLALLSMKEDGGKGVHRAQALLEQLADKFPDSLWTRQSAPLLLHLTEFRTLRNKLRELKTLRELNFSLSRDNKEMRQSLEQLKKLDLELEQRIKR